MRAGLVSVRASLLFEADRDGFKLAALASGELNSRLEDRPQRLRLLLPRRGGRVRVRVGRRGGGGGAGGGALRRLEAREEGEEGRLAVASVRLQNTRVTARAVREGTQRRKPDKNT